jgi:hypothetical protein
MVSFSDPLNAMVAITGTISQTVSNAFHWFSAFLQKIEIFGLNVGFYLLIATYFLIILMFIVVPVWLYPKIVQIKALLYKFFEKVGRNTNQR